MIIEKISVFVGWALPTKAQIWWAVPNAIKLGAVASVGKPTPVTRARETRRSVLAPPAALLHHSTNTRLTRALFVAPLRVFQKSNSNPIVIK